MFKEMNEIEKRGYLIKTECLNDDLKESIDVIIKFLENLSNLIIYNGQTAGIFNKEANILIETELIDSSTFTLNSIKISSGFGSISDSYTLLRKYRDDLFLHLYLLEVSNNNDIFSEKIKKEEFHAIEWSKDKLKNLKISDIIKYLGKNKNVLQIIKKYSLKKEWEKLGRILNNFVHSNGVTFVKKNYTTNIDYKKEFESLKSHILEISLIFIAIYILIKPNFIASSDYIDALDMEIIAEEGSEYWVAPFIQKFIDENLENRFENIKKFLNSSTYMKIK